MLKISISSELATEHPRFMAVCAASGREVHVFAPAEAEMPPRRGPSGVDGRNGAERSHRRPALHEHDDKRR